MYIIPCKLINYLHLLVISADYEIVCTQVTFGLFLFGRRGADDRDVMTKGLSEFHRDVSETAEADDADLLSRCFV